MVNNYTLEELNTVPARVLIQRLINDRRQSTTNPYSPLNSRLTELEAFIQKIPALDEIPPGAAVEFEMERKRKRLAREAKVEGLNDRSTHGYRETKKNE